MAKPHLRFSRTAQEAALKRQKNKCGSCGAEIFALGRAGADRHRFGERSEAHHVIPHKLKGPVTVDNCVILCWSCHLNAHQGGRFADVSIYDDLSKLTLARKIAMISKLYPHFNG